MGDWYCKRRTTHVICAFFGQLFTYIEIHHWYVIEMVFFAFSRFLFSHQRRTPRGSFKYYKQVWQSQIFCMMRLLSVCGEK